MNRCVRKINYLQRLFFLAMLAVFLSANQKANAQSNILVTGQVSDNNNQPLNGVSIQVQGTRNGTTTNTQGSFSLTAPSNAVLLFSYVGYTDTAVLVDNRTTINVQMSSTGSTLADVVVIGYGTASKRDLTGSIARIDGDEVANRPNPNPVASLQGKVAGLNIVNTGTPGAQPDIRLRGTISIGSVRPIYVVDGILNTSIDYINPNDIESIEVLKDASSLAIFGVRGAAGAIVITTKRAKAGQTNINLNTTTGFKTLSNKIKLTNAAQFKELFSEQLANQGDDQFDFTNWTANTNWIDALTQNGLFTTNNISVSGSTEKNRFYMNAGYTYEEGLIRHQSLDKILFNINDEFKVTKNIKTGFVLNALRQKPPYLNPGFNYESMLFNARRVAPIASATPINGAYSYLPGFQSAQIQNPAMELENLYNKNSQLEYRYVANAYIDLTFLKNFNFRATGYGDITNGNTTSYRPILYNYLPDQNDSVVINPGYQYTTLNLGEYRNYKWQEDNILTFKKDFGDHGLTLTAGTTIYYESSFSTTVTGSQSTTGDPIPDNKRLWYIDNALVDQNSVRATAGPQGRYERTTASLLGRVLYNYKGKYLINASYRRDGTSGFANNRAQNFWAVGAAWELSKENFMANQKIFDYLKLKGSIGVLGNQNTTYNNGTNNPYPSYAPLTAGSAVFGNTIYPAYAASYVPDPNLKWETVNAKEVGLELAALQNRLRFEMAYYNKVTHDLLAIQPSVNGFPARLSNIGSIRNEGFEFSGSWNQKLGKDLNLNISANLSTFKNKVLTLYTTNPDGITGASEEYPNRTAVGRPIGFFFGYVQEGIYQNDEDVAKSPVVVGFGDYGPGDMKFKDLDGNDTINSADRTMIGNPTPKFTYGFSLNFSYKSFDLGVDFQGVYGNDIYRYWGTSELPYAPYNYPVWKLNRWHGEGTSNSVPQLNNAHTINIKGLSTFGVESGSYLRIRNIQLGYTIPTQTLQKAGIKAFRVFVSAQNAITWKKNSGFSPEFAGTATSFGIDQGNNPIPAIYTAGLNVTF